LTERVVAEARLFLRDNPNVVLEIWHEGGTPEEMAMWLGLFSYRAQGVGDIGTRMAAALQSAFAAGARRAVLVGSDIPGLDSGIINQAFVALAEHALVLGPSRDGGYYLIGLQNGQAELLVPLLLDDMAWSSETVLAVTLERCAAHGFQASLLPLLHDVDRPEDLELLRGEELLP
jgi:rSAM/selenodomain-associated transferase 1